MKNIIKTLKELDQKGLTLDQAIQHLEKKESEKVKKAVDAFANIEGSFPTQKID